MAINAPNVTDFLNSLTRTIVNIRDDFDRLVNLNNYITAAGGANFLTAAAPNGMGMSAADAATVVSTLGNLAALAGHYNGGAQAPALNYRGNSQALWSGQ